MQAAVCPVCGAFVGHVPDGWLIQITHRRNDAHALITMRPDVLRHLLDEADPNPD